MSIFYDDKHYDKYNSNEIIIVNDKENLNKHTSQKMKQKNPKLFQKNKIALFVKTKTSAQKKNQRQKNKDKTQTSKQTLLVRKKKLLGKNPPYSTSKKKKRKEKTKPS